MRIRAGYLLVALASCGVTTLCRAAERQQCEGQLDPSISLFSARIGDAEGHQTDTILAARCVSGNFKLGIKVAHFDVKVSDNATPLSGSLSGFSDTAVSASYDLNYIFIGKFAANTKISTDLNIPTGKTELDEKEQLALVDTDLVRLSRYGEGWNIGFGINSVVQVADDWGVGLGVGRIWRNEYTPYSHSNSIHPGSSWNLNAEIVNENDQYRNRLFLNTVQESETRLGLNPLFNPSRTSSFGVERGQSLGKYWFISASAIASYSGKAKRYIPGALTPNETEVKSGAAVYTTATAAYLLGKDQRLLIKTAYSDRRSEKVDPLVLDFLPARSSASASLGYAREIGGALVAIDVGFKRLWDRASTYYTKQSYDVMTANITIARKL